MRWTRLCLHRRRVPGRGRHGRSPRMRSSNSTAARRSTSIIGSTAGGGYDAYARALGRHMGKYIPGNPTIVPQNMPGAGGNKAAGYVYSVAPRGRHRHRRAVSRRHPRAAARRHADPARSDEVHLRRQRQQRRLHLRRAHRLADQVLQGRVHAGDHRRRQQRRRHHARHADAGEQRARHEIPHRHRLCRHARDRARGRAQGNSWAVRLRLHQPALGDAAMADRQGRAHPGAGERQGRARAQPAGRAADRRFREDRRKTGR